MSFAIDWERIAELIDVEATLVSASPFEGGMSAVMTLLVLDASSGRERYVHRVPAGDDLQQKASAARRELEVLGVLEKLEIPAPRPVLTVDESDGCCEPFLVMTHIDAAPDYDPADRKIFAQQLASQLVALHCSEVPATDECWFDSFEFDVLADHRSWMQALPDEFRIKDMYERLRALATLPGAGTRCLIHGDYWPGNLLWRDGCLVAVVDWEDARLGDPLQDLSIARLDLSWSFGHDISQFFTACYQRQIEVDPVRLAVWDLAAALRLVRISEADFDDWALSWQQPPFDRRDITPEAFMRDYGRFVERALDTLRGR
tara:strand:- start:992 stop:1942 length:951 start_codon:yes stop_codon:yes gene_type:complete